MVATEVGNVGIMNERCLLTIVLYLEFKLHMVVCEGQEQETGGLTAKKEEMTKKC